MASTNGVRTVLLGMLLQGMAVLGSPISRELCAQTDVSPHSEHRVAVNGVSLQYLDWGGKGETLLFLTGYGAPAHVFDALATQFTDRFRVVALTRRGRAPSEAPATGYDSVTLVRDIAGVLDTLKAARVHLVAHSFGGAEATQLANRYPNRVASIVYLDAALDAAAGEAVLKNSPIPNPQPAPGTPYAQVLRWWNSYTPNFATVRCPTLALFAVPLNPPLPPNAPNDVRTAATEFWQAQMLPMVRANIAKFKREAKNGRVVELENASHYLFRDREKDVVREMKLFYDSLPGQ